VALSLLGAAGVSGEGVGPRAGHIGVVDMERVERESAVGKDYLKRIDALGERLHAEATKRQERLGTLAEEIQRQNDELRRRQATLTPVAAEEAQHKLARKIRERELYQQDSEQELARLERQLQRDSQRLHQELRQRLLPTIEAILKRHSLDVLLDYHLCLGVSPEADFTDEAVADQEERRAPAGPESRGVLAPVQSP
jgi:Skp family chaperone for outer membrane proteins